jgi:hypothetical protein
MALPMRFAGVANAGQMDEFRHASPLVFRCAGAEHGDLQPQTELAFIGKRSAIPID